jgi:reductive dehalogenase
MKVLGLTGAGLGAAAAAAPAFRDLDEVLSASTSKVDRPWFIREVDEPTVEVDWSLKKRWSEVNTLRGSRFYQNTYITPEEQAQRRAQKDEQEQAWGIQGKPGWSTRDRSFSSSAASSRTSNTFMPDGGSTPESLGIPRWEGTPEEAAAMIRTALRFMGSMSVGFVQLDTNTSEKFIYSYEPGGKEELTWKSDGPFEIKNEEHAHPLDARWVIVIANQESQELWKRSNTRMQTQIRYERASHIQVRAQRFLKGLGYWGLSEGGNGTGNAPALAIMAGMGELGRHQRAITPEYGPTVGIFRYITDLPLAPDRPIAEACGEGALSLADEPFWDPAENSSPYDASYATGLSVPGALPPTPGGWHQGGAKCFYEDSRKCRSWKLLPNTCNAGRCHGVCTFTKYHIGSIHEVVSATLSVTPIFNSFFKNMDDAFGYGLAGRAHDNFDVSDAATDAAVDEFWNYNLPIYGIPTSIKQGSF